MPRIVWPVSLADVSDHVRAINGVKIAQMMACVRALRKLNRTEATRAVLCSTFTA